MFFFFWQETREKIGSRSRARRPLLSPPAQAARAPGPARARSASSAGPRASCLVPRASSHVPAPAPTRRRVGGWAARAWVWPADLGGAGLGGALRCALHAGSTSEGLLSVQRTQAAPGGRGSELPPGRRRSRELRLVGAPRRGIPGFPQGAWGTAGPPGRNPARVAARCWPGPAWFRDQGLRGGQDGRALVALCSRARIGRWAAVSTSWAAWTACFGKRGAVRIPGLQTPGFLFTPLSPSDGHSASSYLPRKWLLFETAQKGYWVKSSGKVHKSSPLSAKNESSGSVLNLFWKWHNAQHFGDGTGGLMDFECS